MWAWTSVAQSKWIGFPSSILVCCRAREVVKPNCKPFVLPFIPVMLLVHAVNGRWCTWLHFYTDLIVGKGVENSGVLVATMIWYLVLTASTYIAYISMHADSLRLMWFSMPGLFVCWRYSSSAIPALTERISNYSYWAWWCHLQPSGTYSGAVHLQISELLYHILCSTVATVGAYMYAYIFMYVYCLSVFEHVHVHACMCLWQRSLP